MTRLKSFRSSNWLRYTCSSVAVVSVGVAARNAVVGEWSALTIGLGLFAMLAIAGALDALTTRVELSESELIVTANFRTRTYPRATFVKITAERGAGVSLQKDDGTWLKLPDVSPGGQSLANTLRAWIKR